MRTPLSHSTLGGQRDWKWQRLIKKFPCRQTGETCELDSSTRDTNGETTGIANLSPLSQSSFSRTMRQDKQDTEGRQACRNKEGCLALFYDLRETRPVEQRTQRIPCIAEGAESTLLSAGGGGGGGTQPCFWRRAESYVRLRAWLVIYDAQWKLQSNPPAFTVPAINLFCHKQARSSYVLYLLSPPPPSPFSREPAPVFRSIWK